MAVYCSQPRPGTGKGRTVETGRTEISELTIVVSSTLRNSGDWVMHEFSIATSLLSIIDEEAVKFQGAQVKTVTLKVGTLSGIVPEALDFAFQVLSEGTVAEGARLMIERVPLRIECNACGTTSTPTDPFLICPHCGSGEVEIREGRELEIESMEIEDGG